MRRRIGVKHQAKLQRIMYEKGEDGDVLATETLLALLYEKINRLDELIRTKLLSLGSLY
jgi:hypothetical protein